MATDRARTVAVVLVAAVAGAAMLPLLATATQAETDDGPRFAHRDVPPGFHRLTSSGSSSIRATGACVGALECLGTNDTTHTSLFLPTSGSHGRVTLVWAPASDELRVLRVVVGGFEAVGGSPLELQLPHLPAGEHAVKVYPTGRLVGPVDQQVHWNAEVMVADAPGYHERNGWASYRALAPCAPAAVCDPIGNTRGQPFVVPWQADAALLTVEWTPEHPLATTLEIRVGGSTYAATGESPIVIEMHSLPAGEYTVQVRPTAAWPTGVGQQVAWHLSATQDLVGAT